MNNHELHISGWNEFFEEQFTGSEFDNSFPARVISQQGDIYTILSSKGEHFARVTGRFRFSAGQTADYPVVGDFVIAGEAKGSEDIVIHRVLKRRNYFSRKMPISGGRRLKNGVIDGGTTEEQVIASNIDTVFIICGLDGNFSLPRLERYLTLVVQQSLQAVILLNKSDLCEKPEDYTAQVNAIAGGIPVFSVSAAAKLGLEPLAEYIAAGRTVAFLGSSGVGKSTLLNALFDEKVQLTNSTSEHSGKGRHTTTHRQIFFHPSGCMIIDTPGMKELQLWADDEALGYVYSDIADMISRCRFSDCTHKNEPGCAVREALESGALSRERFERYQRSLRELGRLAEKKKEYDRKVKKSRAHIVKK